MSASEKLRVLGPAISNSDTDFERGARTAFDAMLAIRNALPQIVAVVRAAEVQEAMGGQVGGLREALAALNEALS